MFIQKQLYILKLKAKENTESKAKQKNTSLQKIVEYMSFCTFFLSNFVDVALLYTFFYPILWT